VESTGGRLPKPIPLRQLQHLPKSCLCPKTSRLHNLPSIHPSPQSSNSPPIHLRTPQNPLTLKRIRNNPGIALSNTDPPPPNRIPCVIPRYHYTHAISIISHSPTLPFSPNPNPNPNINISTTKGKKHHSPLHPASTAVTLELSYAPGVS